MIDKYLGNYQKSIFTFLSFFISVFVLKILKNEQFCDVFSKEPTILSLSFLTISLLFLSFSIWNLNNEKKRIERKYKNMKARYGDLLIVDDIDKILRNDEEFNYEMSFIDKRKKIYTYLWVGTIVVLGISVLLVSSYLNFNVIFSWSKTIFA